jgi:hypothetical protein
MEEEENEDDDDEGKGLKTCDYDSLIGLINRSIEDGSMAFVSHCLWT